MSTFRTFVGAVQITAVSDGDLFLEKSFYPDVTDEQWWEYSDVIAPNGRVFMNLGAFVLHSAGRNILVDTGVGPTPGHFHADCGRLPGEMKDCGVPPEQIDTVLMTHLHADHVGWNVVGEGPDRKLGFENARYLAPRVDYEAYVAMSKTPASAPEAEAARQRRLESFVRSVEPLRDFGRLDVYEGEHTVTAEVTTLPSPGHTPGHMCVVISSQGERAIILGDAAHLPLEVHEVDWTCRGDRDPAMTVKTREKLMSDAERDNALVLGGHFPAPGVGRLERIGGRRTWRPL